MSGMDIDVWLDRPVEGGLARRARMRIGVLFGLLFLVGPLSDLVHQSSADGVRVLRAAAVALFVVLYVSLLPPSPWVSRLGARAPQLGVAVLAVLATVVLASGAPRSFVALYVYVVAAGALVFRPRVAAAATLALGIGVGVGLVVTGAKASEVGALVLTIGAIGAMMAAFGRQIHVNRQLRSAREELARLAVSEERLRIARDLHDLLGHTLSVVVLKSELAAKLVERDPARARAELDEVQEVTRRALAEVREAVHSYRHLALDEALAGARAQLDAAGIECSLEESDVPLPADVEAVLAWTVREGATNVVRHSGARRCAIRVLAGDGEAAVEVEDDGRSSGTDVAGSGLAGLAERAEHAHGRLEAGTRPGGGFRLAVSVPLPAS
jgi:two-component system, NarL family, sensor histidine kinase DesK